MRKEAIKIIILCLVAALCLGCFGLYVFHSLTDGPSVSTQPSIGQTTGPTAGSTGTTVPTTSSSQATRPSSETTQPSSEATEPSSQATQPSSEATQPTTEPTQPTTQPTEPATQPTEPTTQPTEPPTEPTEPPVQVTLSARQAFVYDLTAEKMLHIFGDLDAPVEPASITKLFSAYVGLQYLSADTVLTVGKEVEWIGYGSSRAYLYEGYQLTVEMCIQGMIIPSGNDAAYVLAVNAGRAIIGDPNLSARAAYDAFVMEMNRQAWALGMTGTTFVNPDGMNEPGHYTTMRDMLLMAKLALDTPLISQAAAIARMNARLISGQTIEWINSNQLLHTEDSNFYCADAFGLKTGSTSTAGKCLISAFHDGERILLICVMGCPTNEDRYIDTLALYQAFQQ